MMRAISICVLVAGIAVALLGQRIGNALAVVFGLFLIGLFVVLEKARE